MNNIDVLVEYIMTIDLLIHMNIVRNRNYTQNAIAWCSVIYHSLVVKVCILSPPVSFCTHRKFVSCRNISPAKNWKWIKMI